MLNPRMSGAAFELKLTGDEEDFATKAIKIDSQNQEMHIAFTAATAMAKMDRRELINIVNDTDSLFSKYLKINNKNSFIKEMNYNIKPIDLDNDVFLRTQPEDLNKYTGNFHILCYYNNN